eukprot:7384404-Prymnesium_polylepis.1
MWNGWDEWVDWEPDEAPESVDYASWEVVRSKKWSFRPPFLRTFLLELLEQCGYQAPFQAPEPSPKAKTTRVVSPEPGTTALNPRSRTVRIISSSGVIWPSD